MGKDPHAQPSPERKSGTVHFITGSLMLFVMAFVWSIDSSLVYMLLGAATFFFFLGFRQYFASRPRTESFRQRVYETYREPTVKEEKRSVADEFSDLLRQAQQRAQASATSSPSKAAAGKKIALGTLFFIGAIFFVIMIAVGIFGSDPITEEYSAAYTTQTNVEKGDAFYGGQQYDSAYIYFKKAMQDAPENAYPVWGYASSLYMLGNVDSAMLMYDKALAVDPDYDAARFSKAWVYNEQKNYSQAMIEVQQLLQKSPQFHDAYALQGDIFFNQGSYHQALQSYKTAYDSGYRNNALCKTMADLYAQQGNSQDAITYYNEALFYDSADGYSYQRLGELIPGEDGNIYRTKAAEYGK